MVAAFASVQFNKARVRQRLSGKRRSAFANSNRRTRRNRCVLLDLGFGILGAIPARPWTRPDTPRDNANQRCRPTRSSAPTWRTPLDSACLPTRRETALALAMRAFLRTTDGAVALRARALRRATGCAALPVKERRARPIAVYFSVRGALALLGRRGGTGLPSTNSINDIGALSPRRRPSLMMRV